MTSDDWRRFVCRSCNGRGRKWDWGGPDDCAYCQGTGKFFVHLPTRRVAVWPGGPLRGSMTEADLQLMLTLTRQEITA